MSDDLFRDAAVRKATSRDLGPALAAMPSAWTYVLWILLGLFAAASVAVATLKTTKVEYVRGRIVPSNAEVQVFGGERGIIDDVRVTLGGDVNAGEILFRVRTATVSNEGRVIQADSLEALQREREDLNEMRKLGELSHRIAQERIAAQVASLMRQRDVNSQSQRTLQQRLSLADERLASARRLEVEGASSREESRIREEAVLALRQQMADLQERGLMLQDSIDVLALDKRAIEETLHAERLELNLREMQLEKQILQTTSDFGYGVAAPVSGKVAALQAAVGSAVDTSRPLLTIVPEDSEFMVELIVPSRVVTHLEVGQAIEIRIDGSSGERGSTAFGQVTTLSSAALSPDDLISPVNINEPAFSVTVRLEKQALSAGQREMTMHSGMLITGVLHLEQRTILEWLLASSTPVSPPATR